MKINIKAITITTDIQISIITKDIKAATQDNIQLQDLRTYVIEGWSSNRNDIRQESHHTSGTTSQYARRNTQQSYGYRENKNTCK